MYIHRHKSWAEIALKAGIPVKDHQALKAVFNLEGYNRRVARRKIFLTEER
jgi:hypothetical protein